VIREEILKKPHVLGKYLGYTKLSKIHGDWIKYIWNNKHHRAIQAHRGSYKTTSIVVVGSIWYWLFHPNERILIARKEFSGASSLLSEISRNLKSEKIKSLIYELYEISDFHLVKDTSGVITTSLMTRNTKEGNFECTGIGSSKTGAHYERIHFDDIVTDVDRYFPAKREATKRFIRECENLLEPKGIIGATGTPWHKDDAHNILPEAKKYPFPEVPLDKAEKKKIEERIKRLPYSLATANYYLKHVADEESYFANIKYKPLPKKGRLMHIDAKYKGKDTMAITIGCREGNDYYLKGFISNNNIESMYNRIKEWHTMDKCGTCHMEDNADKGLGASALRKLGIPVSSYHESVNKHVKIISFLSGNWENVYFDESSDREYISQIVEYAEGQEPDDAPDGASCMVRILGGSGFLDYEEDFSSNDIGYLYDLMDEDERL